MWQFTVKRDNDEVNDEEEKDFVEKEEIVEYASNVDFYIREERGSTQLTIKILKRHVVFFYFKSSFIL